MDGAQDVGILFADIVGSTRMYEVLGDERALAIVTLCFQEMSAAVNGQNGRVVKTIGDEMMAAFATPEGAFLAALDIRQRIAALPPLPDADALLRPRVRVGLHHGPALSESGDWFGDTVNMAARVVGLAGAGQVLVTGDLADRLPPVLRALATEFAEVAVKGRLEPVRIARVAEDGAASETTQVRFHRAAPAPSDAPTLTLVVQGHAWIPPAGVRRIACGREAGCDILLTGASASRQHATIEVRRDKVVLIDHSSNGTRLTLGDDPPVSLLREELRLYRRGHIIFGRPDAPDADVVAFTVG